MWKLIKSFFKKEKKITYPERIELTLNDDVMRRCSEYANSRDCAVATTLKDMGFKDVIVGPYSADIEKKYYVINDYRKVHEAYCGKLPQIIVLTKYSW